MCNMDGQIKERILNLIGSRNYREKILLKLIGAQIFEPNSN